MINFKISSFKKNRTNLYNISKVAVASSFLMVISACSLDKVGDYLFDDQRPEIDRQYFENKRRSPYTNPAGQGFGNPGGYNMDSQQMNDYNPYGGPTNSYPSFADPYPAYQTPNNAQIYQDNNQQYNNNSYGQYNNGYQNQPQMNNYPSSNEFDYGNSSGQMNQYQNGQNSQNQQYNYQGQQQNQQQNYNNPYQLDPNNSGMYNEYNPYSGSGGSYNDRYDPSANGNGTMPYGTPKFKFDEPEANNELQSNELNSPVLLFTPEKPVIDKTASNEDKSKLNKRKQNMFPFNDYAPKSTAEVINPNENLLIISEKANDAPKSNLTLNPASSMSQEDLVEARMHELEEKFNAAKNENIAKAEKIDEVSNIDTNNMEIVFSAEENNANNIESISNDNLNNQDEEIDENIENIATNNDDFEYIEETQISQERVYEEQITNQEELAASQPPVIDLASYEQSIGQNENSSEDIILDYQNASFMHNNSLNSNILPVSRYSKIRRK